jgi:hypothetical protein
MNMECKTESRCYALVMELAKQANYDDITHFLDDVDNGDVELWTPMVVNGTVIDDCYTCKKQTEIIMRKNERPECTVCECDPYDDGYEDDDSGVPF